MKILSKKLVFLVFFVLPLLLFAQTNNNSSSYKKRVLDNTEIDLLSSYYTQDGDYAAVTGGIGSEKLTDYASNITISIPISIDDILTIDGTVSAYTSASSSNLNPFSGASQEEDDDDDDKNGDEETPVEGSPWDASSGASKKDTWNNANFNYSHYSDDRNHIFNANLNFANEYDYRSFGFGAGYTNIFNQKNTEINVSSNVFLDSWRPSYPTEFISYIKNEGDLEIGFFEGVDILDSLGNVIDKTGPDAWEVSNTNLINNKERNSYTFSLSISQTINKNAQFSLISDLTLQKGCLANPMQRVYFSDKPNFYIGDSTDIIHYTSPQNKGVFQLADDIERLPSERWKFPSGVHFNYYINENYVLNTFYRYYFDDWGVESHTANIEIPIKIPIKFGNSFTLYPSYRFYSQNAADYFAPFDQHISTNKFYTSDYDLSKFTAQQIGFGIKYTDIFNSIALWKLGIKTISLDYVYYWKDNGFYAHNLTLGYNFIID